MAASFASNTCELMKKVAALAGMDGCRLQRIVLVLDVHETPTMYVRSLTNRDAVDSFIRTDLPALPDLIVKEGNGNRVIREMEK